MNPSLRPTGAFPFGGVLGPKPSLVSDVAQRPHQEGELQARTTGSGRVFQLDALRGLAAVTVVLHHLRYVFVYAAPKWYLVPLFAGDQAVDLFFVLSGFVLSLPYLRGRSNPYPLYLIRRFIRIYLPFAAAACISIAGARYFIRFQPSLTIWYQLTWRTRVTWENVLLQFLMWPFAIFNTAFWSLRYEMQLSVAMPVLARIVKRTNGAVVLLCSFALAFGRVRWIEGLDRFHFAGTTLQIGSLFILGAVIARYEKPLRSAVRRLGPAAWLVLIGFLFLYYAYPTTIQGFPDRLWLVDRWRLLSGLGAAGIVVFALELQPFASALRNPVAEYLGRISYSLYLVHSIVLFAAFDLLTGRVRARFIAGIVLVGALALAHVFCVWVEEPCIRLSQRLKGAARASSLKTS